MDSPNSEQAAFWSTGPGRHWVRFQDDLDMMHEEALALLLEAAGPRPGERVLDIGCGAGASSFALAESVGKEGHVDGADISEPLVAAAEARRVARGAENVGFRVADAQVAAFPGGQDLVVSRFGVMFFADTVAAFRNLGQALKPRGRLAFVAWQGPEANPWFRIPQEIVDARLGAGEPPPPDAPGPMRFRDAARVGAMLEEAGFAAVEARPVTVDLHHPGGVEAVMRLVPNVGPLPRAMRERQGTEADQAAILDRVADALRRYAGPDGIRVPAGVLVFTARWRG